MLVSSSIPNMVNGVSQQPYTLRLASQAEEQENGLSTVAQGLMKRPPTKHIAKLGPAITGSAYIHTINRDTEERYTVIITDGDLRVFDLDGDEKTVNFPEGKAYITAADPAKTFKAVTVADYTFILNRNMEVEESTDAWPTRVPEALVVVKAGQYGKTYVIKINGVDASFYTAPDGSVPDHSQWITTEHIALSLYNGLVDNGYNAELSGSSIRIWDNDDFSVTTSDGYNGSAMAAFKDQVQRFSDLPADGVINGFTVEVVGDIQNADDNYWVTFQVTTGGGVWKESVQPGAKKGFVDETMPWALVREADGTFTFKPLEWGKRIVGDEGSAPNPSFVGRKISDIFFYRNRLGLLSDEAVIFSEAGEYFNFYPTTVAQLLDSDPIDYSVSHTKVSLLNFAVPFNKELMLFSSQTQFTVESGDLLTAKTMVVKTATEFECNPEVRPVGVGNNIYFATPKGFYEGVREYFISDVTETEDAADVTSHVPKYIPEGVYKIAATSNEDLVCVLTSAKRNEAFIYKFYWSGNEKLQSSWSRWIFSETDEILNADFIQSTMILIINRPDGLYLESVEVAPEEEALGEPYPIHLDRKITLPANTLAFDGTNTILPIPWNANDGEYSAVVANNQPHDAGTLLDVEYDEISGDAYVRGDYSDCDLIVGRRYKFRYVFSPLMIRTSFERGQQSDTVGRLQIRKVAINYANTGYFQVEVTPHGRDKNIYTYSGKTLGLPSATIGALSLADGQFSFPVLSRNTTVDIELVSDSPLPCSFLSADWEGFYVRRSRQV